MKCSLRPFISGIVVVALVIVFGANGASASIIQFQGGDAGANSTDPRPVSNATAASFDAAAGALGAINLITFESAPVGSFSSLVVAPGVTLTGTNLFGNPQSIRNTPMGTPDSLFGYDTTSGGRNFAALIGGTLTFTFATPIDAFGGYISGLQLSGETISFNDGSSQTIDLLNLGSAGGVQFAGFTDAGRLISSITLNATVGLAGDDIGVDDVRYVASSATTVPEPTSLVLLGTGLVGMVLFRGRRKI